ncbi:MAG: FtsX-like permease family protein [Ktedonobacteraceae bacterium]
MLSNFSFDMKIAAIPITTLLALVLFLVNTMSVALVERQTATIATLRSRGATRRHVFGTFVTQGVLPGLLALLIGPFVAVLLLEMLVHLLFCALSIL